MTGVSASCFGEQYRDLLLLYFDLHQKLDENNSSQQAQIAVEQFIQYTILCSYVASNSVLVADGEITSAVSPTRRGAPRRDVWNAESPTKGLCLP